MSPVLKMFGLVVGIGVLVIGIGVYVVFNGLPWKKFWIAKEAHTYLEQKYNETFVLKKRVYNFKDGSYGGIFYSKNNPNVLFTAEKWENHGTFHDVYPEKVWIDELSKDVLPMVQPLYPEPESLYIDTVYGKGEELNIQKTIPSYKEVKSGLFIVVRPSVMWSKENEKKEAEKILHIVKNLQLNDINVEFTLYFTSKEEAKKTHYIEIPCDQIKHIHSVDDVLKHVGHF